MKKPIEIFRFLLGFKIIKVSEKEKEQAANLLISNNLPGNISEKGEITISARHFRSYREALINRVSFCESDLCGLPGIFVRIGRRYGVLCALIFCLLLVGFTSDFIFDVRVEDGDGLTDTYVIYEAEKVGVFVGARWSKMNRDAMEAEIAESSDGIGWVNIERVGNVAVITVRKKETVTAEHPSRDPCDIVAAIDCIAEEITVSSGVPQVAIGDAVRAGDVLISGVLPSELGGGVCHAEGLIIGKVSRTVTVECPRVKSETLYGKEILSSAALSFLNFQVNILKNSGNPCEKCVIIEEKRVPILPGDVRLPICLCLTFRAEACGTVKRNLSDGELIALTGERLNTAVWTALADADLSKIRTSGGFTEIGYRMTAEMELLHSVGEERPISE